MVRSPLGPSLAPVSLDTVSRCLEGQQVPGSSPAQGPVRVRWGWRLSLAFLVKVLGREEFSGGRPRRVHVCLSADITGVSSKVGMGKIRARLAKSLGLAFCRGRASWQEEARPPPVPSSGAGSSGSREG